MKKQYSPPRTFAELIDFEPDSLVTQAERIVGLFGGASKLHRALEALGVKKNKSSIYRWLYDKKIEGRKNRGTGGMVPAEIMPAIVLAAQLEGLIITAEDRDPLPRKKRVVKND